MELLNLTSANLTNSTGSPAHFIWKAEKMVPAVIMSVCFLVGFPGNVAALILRPWQQLSTLTQCLMVNLASSDLLCLVTLLFCIYSSVLTVTALSVQRYMQVVHPHRSLQFKKRRLVLMWLMSMVLSTPMLAFRQIIVDQQKNFCVSHYSSQPQQLAVILTEFTLGFSSFIICSQPLREEAVSQYQLSIKRAPAQTLLRREAQSHKLSCSCGGT
uniref:G-protein coupled receptors family 1 profile domain-containing protein n=1 Tax=Knipowitschia caucasica TaxID=637954 RepID=A0AAV2K8K3_KNICA